MIRISIVAVILLCSGMSAETSEGKRFVWETHQVTSANDNTLHPIMFKLDSAGGTVERLAGETYRTIRLFSEHGWTPSQTMQHLKILNQLESIRIPEVNFRKAPVDEVIASLAETCTKLQQGNEGPHITLDPAALSETPRDHFQDPFAPIPAANEEAEGDKPDVALITFSARDIKLREALQIVCESSSPRLTYEVTDKAVVIRRRLWAQEGFETRPFTLPRSAVDHFETVLVAPQRTASGSLDYEDTWKTYLSAFGVGWPEKANLQYFPLTGMLVVQNTTGNNATLETVIGSILDYHSQNGRFSLRERHISGRSQLMLHDGDTGRTWIYTIIEQDAKTGEPLEDAFLSIPTKRAPARHWYKHP